VGIREIPRREFVLCPKCGGMGSRPCPTCRGTGFRFDSEGRAIICLSCGGSGERVCTRCKGFGKVTR